MTKPRRAGAPRTPRARRERFGRFYRRRARWRSIADILLFCLLAGTAIYGIARFLPEQELGGNAAVIDGDSLRVDGREIRLGGIDAPEARQTCRDESGGPWPCGREATAALKRLTSGAQVHCSGNIIDDYGRLVARCTAGTLDLSGEMVRLGFAVSDLEQGFVYAAEQRQARDAKRGIWRGTFDPPHKWRAGHERPPGATK